MKSEFEYPVRFMAVDAGSNATKYRAWEIESPARVAQIAERRYPIRLGAGVFTRGRIADETIAAAVEVFQSIRDDAGQLGVGTIRAVTTSAAREAQNTPLLVDAIRRATGIVLEAIADEREARLIGLGVLSAHPVAGECVIADVGGGSTEVIRARGGEIDFAVSLPLGAVRLAEMFFSAIPPVAGEVGAMENHLRDVLGRMPLLEPLDVAAEMIGSGGTITTLNFMAGGNGGVTLAEIAAIIERLRGMSVPQILAAYPVDEARAEIILAGALVLKSVMEKVGLRKMILIRSGVSDGLLREFMRQ